MYDLPFMNFAITVEFHAFSVVASQYSTGPLDESLVVSVIFLNMSLVQTGWSTFLDGPA